ncbi:uncharacterized protein NEMAJ01_1949, partial [Nematocida major]
PFMYTLTGALIENAVSAEKSPLQRAKESLSSGEKRLIIKAFHIMSTKSISYKEKAQLFPQVLSLIGHDAIEVKCLAYSFVLRSLRSDSSLLILAVNTVKQEISGDLEYRTPLHALKTSLAFDFISKVKDPEFLNHFSYEIEKSFCSSSDIIRKSALLAAPALFAAFRETKTCAIRQALDEKSPVVLGAAISALVSIERQAAGTFSESDLVHCFRVLCKNRQGIEETHGNFPLLFSRLCRLLQASVNCSLLETAALVLEFLPLCALKELASMRKELLALPVVEKIANSMSSYIGTRSKTEALECILFLLQTHAIKLETDPFVATSEDTPKEKILKMHILFRINSSEGLEEIVSSLRDRDCTYNAACLLLEMDALREEDVREGFRCSESSMLRALYTKHPLPEKLSPTVRTALANMSNVSEKEAYLFLAGYYLSEVPDEANRIKRIRNAAHGILYGKKEEREKPEEHLEEYLYFLLNMYVRGVLSKESCIQQAGSAFSDEQFMLNKFMHLVDLPDKKHLEDVIAYKRVLYKVARIP